jgi:hypothetical protein
MHAGVIVGHGFLRVVFDRVDAVLEEAE